MCIAVPHRVVNVNKDGLAEIEINGILHEVNCQMFPEIREGDYVLVYLGSVISRMDAEEAGEVLRLFEEIDSLSIEA